MSGSSGPIRLDPDLLEQAAIEAARQQRTTPKKIEFWASLGKALDGVLSKEEAIGLRGGYLGILGARSKPVSRRKVLKSVAASRERLPELVTKAKVAYQASASHPGYLEQLHADGRKIIGLFENGSFQALKQ